MPYLLPNSQLRQYKLRRIEGKGERWLVIRKKIRTPEHLSSYIDSFKPTDVYQTISYWLNPQKLSTKRIALPKYTGNKEMLKEAKINAFLSNMFIGSDYIMDFDDKDYANGNIEALDNVKLAKLALNELGMKDFMLMRTGRGYQLLVFDFNDWAKKGLKAVMPKDREHIYLQRMKKLTEILRANGIKWDYGVSCDTRRICRVPNTIYNGDANKIIKIVR
jgi:hypothetical protein